MVDWECACAERLNRAGIIVGIRSLGATIAVCYTPRFFTLYVCTIENDPEMHENLVDGMAIMKDVKILGRRVYYQSEIVPEYTNSDYSGR